MGFGHKLSKRRAPRRFENTLGIKSPQRACEECFAWTSRTRVGVARFVGGTMETHVEHHLALRIDKHPGAPTDLRYVLECL